MAFPFSSSGVILVDTAASHSVSEVLSRISNAIEDQKPSSMEGSTDTVSFTSGIFRFVGGWNILVPISSGSIKCVQTSEGIVIHYHLAFTQMLVVVSLMVIVMFGIIARAPIPFLFVGWAWLFGTNYALMRYRFPRFLLSALSGSHRKTMR